MKKARNAHLPDESEKWGDSALASRFEVLCLYLRAFQVIRHSCSHIPVP